MPGDPWLFSHSLGERHKLAVWEQFVLMIEFDAYQALQQCGQAGTLTSLHTCHLLSEAYSDHLTLKCTHLPPGTSDPSFPALSFSHSSFCSS